MSFQCQHCGKKLSTNQRLYYHQYETKIPCDYKCRECGKDCKSKNGFKHHKKFECDDNGVVQPRRTVTKKRKTETTVVSSKENVSDVKEIVQTGVEPAEPAEPTILIAKDFSNQPIPINDFNVDVLKMFRHSSVEDIERALGAKVELIRQAGVTDMAFLNRDGNIQYDRVSFQKESIIIRTIDARKALTNNMMYSAMLSLRPEVEMQSIERIATDMMYNLLHHNDPRLHNICLGDAKRCTVHMLSRDTESHERRWMLHEKQTGMEELNNFARNLLEFLLESGTQSLVSAIWRGKPCLSLAGDIGWSVILFDSPRGLIVDKTISEELMYSPINNLDTLMQLVQARKDEVLEKLKQLIIANEDLERCLNDCRQFCIVTMKKDMKSMHQ